MGFVDEEGQLDEEEIEEFERTILELFYEGRRLKERIEAYRLLRAAAPTYIGLNRES